MDKIVIYINDFNNKLICKFNVSFDDTLNILFENINLNILHEYDIYKLVYDTIIIDHNSIQSYYTIVQFMNNHNIINKNELYLNLIFIDISPFILQKISYNNSENCEYSKYTKEEIQEYYNIIFISYNDVDDYFPLLDDNILKHNINFIIHIFYNIIRCSWRVKKRNFNSDIDLFFDKVKHLYENNIFLNDLVFCFKYSIKKCIYPPDFIVNINYTIMKFDLIFNNNIITLTLYKHFSQWLNDSN